MFILSFLVFLSLTSLALQPPEWLETHIFLSVCTPIALDQDSIVSTLHYSNSLSVSI